MNIALIAHDKKKELMLHFVLPTGVYWKIILFLRRVQRGQL